MADDVEQTPTRGTARTAYWSAECKDCAAEQRLSRRGPKGAKARGCRSSSADGSGFEYSGAWADKAFDQGQSRSDRCERHRRLHRQAIRALAVPYVDLDVIGTVRDRRNPTGPLGGLGALPPAHQREEVESELQGYGFGMSDEDILEILDGLKDKKIAVIEAGTGSGKSTFMPFRLMNPPAGAPFQPTKNGPIVVTEPRRAAATGVATFVGESLAFGHDSRKGQSHIGPGYPVGYQVSGDRRWDGACDLIYVTDGTMINWVRDGSLARIGMVIVDEAHERSENIDIILAQLREKVLEYDHLRVIITSATIDKDFFVSYFGGEDKVFHHFVPEKKSFGYGVPLFVDLDLNSHIIANGLSLNGGGDVIQFGGWSGSGPEYEGFPPDDLAKETVKYATLRCVDEIPLEKWRDEMPGALARQVLSIAKGTSWGDILGFLPTTRKIDEAIALIKRGLEDLDLEFDVYPLLSSTDAERTRKAIAARRRGDKRKIVVSSNLAETSLTVSGVRYVVDSGLICQSEWNTELASGSLPIKPHSQSGLRQRWGRVGRDSPGWVFPLYTQEQFLSLPRDTPPEATRKNLEAFCTKLIASGLDVESAVLPASFEDPAFRPDEFGKMSAETFNSELSRASRVLRKGGLTDPDGDLTEIGREIERYSGEASEALAIAVADRTACVHEVALAVAVLVKGTLYGKTTHSILRTDFGWPPEWRLRALACHSALADGCLDDLELAVRLASLYLAAQDKSHWCRTWWVNEAALVNALDVVASIVGSLSAHMKSEAARPFLLSLLPRARAALVYAFQDNVFTELEDGSFGKEGIATPAELQAHRLVKCGPSVIAFQRYEKKLPGQEDRRFISHFVDAAPEFIEKLSSGLVKNDFDLLLQLRGGSHQQKTEEMSQNDVLRHARDVLPIGSIVRLETAAVSDGSYEVLSYAVERNGFLAPIGRVGDGSYSDDEDDESGFDREWDLFGSDEAIPDEDEEAQNPVDPRALEINDRAEEGSALIKFDKLSVPISSDTPIFVRLLFDATAPVQEQKYLVAGCENDNGKAVILVEPFDPDNQNVDPARHDRLRPFDEVDVEFLDVASDHYDAFLRFRVLASAERIDVPARKLFSLDPYEEAMARDLKKGEVFKGLVVVPKPSRRSLSFKAWVRDSLNKAGVRQDVAKGKIDRLHSARIASEPNEYEKVLVELEDGIYPGDIMLRTMVWTGWLGEQKGIPISVGQKLRIGFGDNSSNSTSVKSSSDALDSVAKRSGGKLKIQGQKVIATTALDLRLARQLVNLQKSEKWASEVSRFFEHSLTVNPVLALPPVYEKTSEPSELACKILAGFHRRREFEQRFDVRAKVIESQQIEVSAQNEELVAAAIEAISVFEASSYVALRMPDGTAGKVIGKGGQTLKTLQAMSRVEWIWVDDDDVLHIVGETSAATNAVINRVKPMVETVTGLVFVPSNQIGAFIGPKGAHIQSASSTSQTRNSRTGVDGQWRLEGASVAALELFASLGRKYANGLTMQVISRNEVEVLVNQGPKRKKSGRSTKSDASPRQAALRKKTIPPKEPTEKAEPRKTSAGKRQTPTSSSVTDESRADDEDTSLLGFLRKRIWGSKKGT